MKNIWKIGLMLTVCALLCITVVTATDNKDLPPQEEVTKFIEEMKGKTASDIFDNVKEEHKDWNADLLHCGSNEAVALYYTDSGSKGYGSIYVKDGEIVSPSSLKGYTVKDKYIGELENSENTTEENTSTQPKENNSTVIKDDEIEKSSNNTYDAFKTALDNYDGKTDCTSMGCATSLSDYFKDLGWNTEVKYCVAVDTSDEGTVYVVLGA